MNMYDGVTFLSKIGPFKMCDLYLGMYVNHDYECSCGEKHKFSFDSNILCQGAFKLVLECPNDKEYITCVKLKSKFLGFGFSKFESLFGTKLVLNNVNSLPSYDKSNIDENDINSFPDEIKNSSLIFRAIIKKKIGLI